MGSREDEGMFNLSEDTPTEVREFLDLNHRRASFVDGDRMMTDPGKVLTNIENTMRRLDNNIDIEVSIAEDIATDKELMVMMGELMMGSSLVVFLVNTGMQIMQAGDYPAELVTTPLPDHYDLTTLVPALQVNERQHQIARTILNRRLTSPVDLTEADVDDDLEPLDLAEKMEVFVIVFYMWGTKIGAMKNVTGADS